MGFRINTNTAALAAHASATMNNRALDSSLSKLNSGFRITSAADDASGMAIADSLRSQANALGQAIMNANDAIGVIQTADKAMDEQIKILDTIKTKAIQAAQDTQTTETRRALQADINRLMEQLDNIGNTTSFNGQKLLSGNFSNKEFQIGAYSNETIKASIGPTTTDKIGLTRFETGHNIRLNDVMFAEGMEKTEDGEDGIMSDGKMTLTFKNVDGINDVTLEPVKFASFGKDENGNKTLDIKAGQGLGALVEAINKASDTTGIRASANVKSVFGHVISQGVTTENFRINGVTIGKIEVQSKDANGALRAAINRVKDQTGVEASVDSRGRLVLANRDGRGIKVEDGKLPAPSSAIGEASKPTATRPANSANTPAAPAGELRPSTPPKTPAQAIANATMHQTPTSGLKVSADKAAALDTLNTKTGDATAKIAVDDNGRLSVAAATTNRAGNQLTLADVATAIEATNFADEVAARAQNVAVDVLKGNFAAAPNAQRSARSEGALDFSNLDLSKFAFENNVDVSGAVFGSADDKVGNLDGIRGAKNLQDALNEVRAGQKQLADNITKLKASTVAIGNDAASAVTAQRLAVMMDRAAQLEGFAKGINGVAQAWKQDVSEPANVVGKGVAVADATGAAQAQNIAGKFDFKESSASSAPALSAGTAQDGSAVSGKPAGQLTAADLPANHPANTGEEVGGPGSGTVTPEQALANMQKEAKKLAGAADATFSAAVNKDVVTKAGTSMALTTDSTTSVTGLNAAITAASSTLTSAQIITALGSTSDGGNGVLDYVKTNAKTAMLNALHTKYSTSTTEDNQSFSSGDFSNLTAVNNGPLEGAAVTNATLTNSNFDTATSLADLVSKLGNMITAIDLDTNKDVTATTNAETVKTEVGKALQKAQLEGFKSAAEDVAGLLEGGGTISQETIAQLESYGITAKLDTNKHASVKVSADTTQAIESATGLAALKGDGVAALFAGSAGNTLTVSGVKAALFTDTTLGGTATGAGAEKLIAANAKKAMATALAADGVLAQGGKITLAADIFTAGKTLDPAAAGKVFGSTGVAPSATDVIATTLSQTAISKLKGAKDLSELSAAITQVLSSDELAAATGADAKKIASTVQSTSEEISPADAKGEVAKVAVRAMLQGYKAAVDEISAAASALSATPVGNSLRSTRAVSEGWAATASSGLASAKNTADFDGLATLKTNFANALDAFKANGGDTDANKTALAHAAQNYQAGIEKLAADAKSAAATALATANTAWNDASGDTGLKNAVDALATEAGKTMKAELVEKTWGDGNMTIADIKVAVDALYDGIQDTSNPDTNSFGYKWNKFTEENDTNAGTISGLINTMHTELAKVTDTANFDASEASAWGDLVTAAAGFDSTKLAAPQNNVTTSAQNATAIDIAAFDSVIGTAVSTKTYAHLASAISALATAAAEDTDANAFQLGLAVGDYNAVAALKTAVDGVKFSADGIVQNAANSAAETADTGALAKATWTALVGTGAGKVNDAAAKRMGITGGWSKTDADIKQLLDNVNAAANAKKDAAAVTAASAGNAGAVVAGDKSTYDDLPADKKLTFLLQAQNKIAADLETATPKITVDELWAKPGKVGEDPTPAQQNPGQGTEQKDPATEGAENAQGTGQTTTPSKPSVTPGDNSDKNLAANGNVPTLSAEEAAKPLGDAPTAAKLDDAKAQLASMVDAYATAKTDGTLTNEQHVALALQAQKVQAGIDQVAEVIEQKATAAVTNAKTAFEQKTTGAAIKTVADDAATAVKGKLTGGSALKFGDGNMTLGEVVDAAKKLATAIEGRGVRADNPLAGKTELLAAIKKVAEIDVAGISAGNLDATIKKITDAFGTGGALETALAGLDTNGKNAVASAIGGSVTFDKFNGAVTAIGSSLGDKTTADKLGTIAKDAKAVADLVEAVDKGETANLESLLNAAKDGATALGVEGSKVNNMPAAATVTNDLKDLVAARQVLAKVQELRKDPSKASAAGDKTNELLDQINKVMNSRQTLATIVEKAGVTLDQLGAEAGRIGEAPKGEPAKLPEKLKVVTKDEGTYADPALADGYASKKMPSDWKAPETEGAERLTEGLEAREEVTVNMAALTNAKELGGLVKAGSKADEIVDVRDLLDPSKAGETSTDVDTLTGALKTAKVFDKITDTAAREMTQKLADAIGENIDGSLPEGVSLEFLQSIGGEWQHDNSLLEAANSATNLTDLRHELEKAREALNRDGIALSDAPENPFADEDAELYAALEDETAAPGRPGRRALGDSAAVGKNASEDDVAIARQTLAKLDAIAQIDGWLGAIDEARLALDELSEEREDMGKSLADIIGLNTENSVNFGRLSLVGAGAKDIQLEITDAHGNDMTSAAGFDRDVHEKTVSLRETNAKTERDVAAAQGFNAEDWMDDDLGENANGYPAGVMTFKGAQAMIDIAETAQKALEAIRSDLGSVQNQLVVTVNNISVTQVNVKAAESNIRDVDFAQESATFSKHQILAQSGVYAMSQANAVQQNVMRLLQ